ncbi:MAG: hypothetical protein M1837_002902 [Sclerophora amabilis]|nr:MAG: hypothetical protein M1837_002902 [Sclerophora amabilis]
MAPQSRGKKTLRPSIPQASVSSPDLLAFPNYSLSPSASPNRTPTAPSFPSAPTCPSPPSLPLSPTPLSPTSVETGSEDAFEQAYDEQDDEDFLYHYSVHPSSSNSSDSSVDHSPTIPRPRRASLPHTLSGTNPFAPPFYNRPPTPLPPSPSLTSLLRPSFSTTTSRPTTPDSSDAETPNDTEEAVAKSARTATTVPPASPQVPTYEYYGFVLYLISSLAFLMYLLWSYLPSPFLHQLGISYYPNRWWSLAIPSFLVMTIVYIYVALASYNTGYLTLPMTSIENFVDDAANIAVLDRKGKRGANRHTAKAETKARKSARNKKGGSAVKRNHRYNGGKAIEEEQGASSDGQRDWRAFWDKGTDAVMDVPVGGVCEILYGEGRQIDSGEEDEERDDDDDDDGSIRSMNNGDHGVNGVVGNQGRKHNSQASI